MLSEEGNAKAVAFDEIDKAPEEKKRGITIATVGILFEPNSLAKFIWIVILYWHIDSVTILYLRPMLSMRRPRGIMLMWIVQVMLIMSK